MKQDFVNQDHLINPPLETFKDLKAWVKRNKITVITGLILFIIFILLISSINGDICMEYQHGIGCIK